MQEAKEKKAVREWWQISSRRWFAFLKNQEEQVFLVLTLVIGALVGLTVVAFIVLTERFGARIYPPGGAAWHRLLAPIVGSLTMGYLLFKYFPNARGSGVPQTKAALYALGGRISLGTVFGKFFCTSVTLASGIPLGREGPSVASWRGAFLRSWACATAKPGEGQSTHTRWRGRSSGRRLQYSTRSSSVLRSKKWLETSMPRFSALSSLASATSWAMLRLLLGNDPLFKVPQYKLVMSPWEFVVYAILGVLGGFVSVAFTQLLLRLRAKFLRFPRNTLWFQPLFGGLARRNHGVVRTPELGRRLLLCRRRAQREASR